MQRTNEAPTLEQQLLLMSDRQLCSELPQALVQLGLFSDQEVVIVTDRVLKWRHQNCLEVIEWKPA